MKTNNIYKIEELKLVHEFLLDRVPYDKLTINNSFLSAIITDDLSYRYLTRTLPDPTNMSMYIECLAEELDINLFKPEVISNMVHTFINLTDTYLIGNECSNLKQLTTSGVFNQNEIMYLELDTYLSQSKEFTSDDWHIKNSALRIMSYVLNACIQYDKINDYDIEDLRWIIFSESNKDSVLLNKILINFEELSTKTPMSCIQYDKINDYDIEDLRWIIFSESNKDSVLLNKILINFEELSTKTPMFNLENFDILKYLNSICRDGLLPIEIEYFNENNITNLLAAFDLFSNANVKSSSKNPMLDFIKDGLIKSACKSALMTYKNLSIEKPSFSYLLDEALNNFLKNYNKAKLYFQPMKNLDRELYITESMFSSNDIYNCVGRKLIDLTEDKEYEFNPEKNGVINKLLYKQCIIIHKNIYVDLYSTRNMSLPKIFI